MMNVGPFVITMKGGAMTSKPQVSSKHRPSRRGALVFVGALTAGVILTACGGTDATALLAYATCMRAHGVTSFPDPTGSGGIPKRAAVNALASVSNSQSQAAQTACRNLEPTGGLSGQNNETITVQDQQYYLKVAACMRTRGITNFPEPSFFGGSVEFQGLGHLPGVHSLLFTQSFQICQKLIPTRLPYAGAGD